MIDQTHIQKKGALLLLMATILALVLSNTENIMGYHVARTFTYILENPIHLFQHSFLHFHFSLEHVINDLLMVVFFYYVSLEIKYEMAEGSLSSKKLISLPLISALGGMILPALIYLLFNYSNPFHVPGWGIPIATDIAFSLALASILVPRKLKAVFVFLLALAVFDDIGAIVLIALYYTKEISYHALLFSFSIFSFLVWMNGFGIERFRYYLPIGALLWLSLLFGGVHPTISGVALALIQPIDTYESKKEFMSIFERLTPWVYYCILPMFALANAGVHLGTVTTDQLFHPVLIGIVFGLTIGKPIGIASFAYLGTRLKIAELPLSLTFRKILAIGFLCGIGFTMSLFIGTLAFHNSVTSVAFADGANQFPVYVRLGVMIGSLLSAAIGVLLFWKINRINEYENS